VIAAMVVVLLGSGLLLRYYRPQPATATADSYAGGGTNEITTRYGSKTKVTLPDGTVVWINSGSKLVYNNRSFGLQDREVTLVGEGFFDVAHDAVHPFIIHAGKISVKVLGTSFDIKSYPEDKTVEATLIKGSIEVTITDRPQKKVLLKPHEKLTVFTDDRMITQNLDAIKPDDKQKGYKITPMTFIPSDSTVVETSWVQNKLAFRSEPFSDLAVQMERWYNVHINFSDGKVKQYRFTGIFVNESLDQALKALQITAPFHYRIEKNQVYISKP
jgi:ferric-dicitrate binding protein FerR (iron transport regulator)